MLLLTINFVTLEYVLFTHLSCPALLAGTHKFTNGLTVASPGVYARMRGSCVNFFVARGPCVQTVADAVISRSSGQAVIVARDGECCIARAARTLALVIIEAVDTTESTTARAHIGGTTRTGW